MKSPMFELGLILTITGNLTRTEASEFTEVISEGGYMLLRNHAPMNDDSVKVRDACSLIALNQGDYRGALPVQPSVVRS